MSNPVQPSLIDALTLQLATSYRHFTRRNNSLAYDNRSDMKVLIRPTVFNVIGDERPGNFTVACATTAREDGGTIANIWVRNWAIKDHNSCYLADSWEWALKHSTLEASKFHPLVWQIVKVCESYVSKESILYSHSDKGANKHIGMFIQMQGYVISLRISE